MDRKIKFRPIRPYSPHLNGRVERSQRTDRIEFYTTVDHKDPKLKVKLKEWQNVNNQIRPHMSLGGKSPIARYREQRMKIPNNKDIAKNYRGSLKDYRSRDYAIDQRINIDHYLCDLYRLSNNFFDKLQLIETLFVIKELIESARWRIQS